MFGPTSTTPHVSLCTRRYARPIRNISGAPIFIFPLKETSVLGDCFLTNLRRLRMMCWTERSLPRTERWSVRSYVDFVRTRTVLGSYSQVSGTIPILRVFDSSTGTPCLYQSVQYSFVLWQRLATIPARPNPNFNFPHKEKKQTSPFTCKALLQSYTRILNLFHSGILPQLNWVLNTLACIYGYLTIWK